MPARDPANPIVQVESTLTCPRCGHQSLEQMPIDSCRFFYTCKGCGETLKGDVPVIVEKGGAALLALSR